MATNITTRATINLSVNGADAFKRLDELRDRSKRLKEEITRLESAPGNNSARLSKLRQQFADVSRELNRCQTEVGRVNDVMRRLDSASPKDLNAALRTLRTELNSIERGSAAWDAHVRKIQQVQAEIDRCNASIRSQESVWSRMNNRLNEWQTSIMGAAAAVTGLLMAGKAAVNEYAEMDQEMANVRKFTGMTEADVSTLNESFKAMDTRSGRDQLNRLAQEAGRLGKQSQDDVLGFVRAADKINVALDDLGDGATLTLSKLTGIFGEEKRLGTERSLLAVGSVINELSQNCSASAPYIAQFASRMGGVAAQAGLSVQQVMAFAAVLDTTNQGVEASSTAVSQVITRLFQDTAKYARVAGLDVKEFTKLLKEDTNAAFIQFLETLSKAGGLEVLSPMFKDMGENGARAIAALSSLAEHIDEVKAQQEVANQAFREASSINKEFDVQNNTVLANMEKSRKNLSEIAIELGQKLQPVLKYVYSSSSLFLRALSSMVSFIAANSRTITALVAAITAYATVAALATLRTKAMASAQSLAAAAAGKLRAALAAIKANPVALVAAAVAALVTVLASAARRGSEFKK